MKQNLNYTFITYNGLKSLKPSNSLNIQKSYNFYNLLYMRLKREIKCFINFYIEIIFSRV